MFLLPEIVFVVGARPNFMKVAPIVEELQRECAHIRSVIVHTGQHYDANMSDVFLRELNITDIDEFLGVGSGTHGYQTARVCDVLNNI